jgi:hypothetical protein
MAESSGSSIPLTHLSSGHADLRLLEPIDGSVLTFEFVDAPATIDAGCGEGGTPSRASSVTVQHYSPRVRHVQPSGIEADHDCGVRHAESSRVEEDHDCGVRHLPPPSRGVEAGRDWRILPTELWQQIALFACVDGGRTGCALSLVSQDMRAITSHSRYHTLAFSSSRGVVLFARHLERAWLARVACAAMLIAPQPNAHSRFDRFEASPQETLDDTGVAAALIVLHATAPTLELLCSVTWGALGGTRVLELIEFPALRDLIWDEGVMAATTARATLPSLQRLHVSRLTLPAAFATLAPNLVELRISRALAPSHMFEMLVVEPQLHPIRRDRTKPIPRLGRSLRRIVICPDYNWVWDSWYPRRIVASRVARAAHKNTLAVLRGLERPGRAWTGEVLLVCRSAEINPRSEVEDHRLDWTDLLAGGCGPWISDDQAQNSIPEGMLLVSVV